MSKNATATEIVNRISNLGVIHWPGDDIVIELARVVREVEAKLKAEQQGEDFKCTD